MAATIPAPILGLRGQCVKRVSWNEARGTLVFHCHRDRRYAPVDDRTGARGTVNRRLRRDVLDMPLCGQPVVWNIEYSQIKIGAVDRRMARLDFADPGCGTTRRFARLIAHLCRHMPINAVARFSGLAWRTVKAMDRRTLEHELPALDPGALTDLRRLGVDEVARAKGHDYLTLVYDRDTGDLVWVTEGRSKAGLLAFFDQLDDEVAQGMQAVAMDMAGPFAAAVEHALP